MIVKSPRSGTSAINIESISFADSLESLTVLGLFGGEGSASSEAVCHSALLLV